MQTKSHSYGTSKPRGAGSPLLHYYELWEGANGKTHSRSGILPHEDIEDWLDLKGNYHVDGEELDLHERGMILRLIACDFDRHPFALGCGHVNFQKIRKAFHLHESSEEAILNNNGSFGRFFTRKPGSSSFSSFALVLKVANAINIGYDAISMSYDLETKQTRAFIHGFLDDETARLIQHLQIFTDRAACYQPLFLPARIFHDYRAKTEAYRIAVDDSLHRTEVRIGYAIPGMLQGKPQRYFRTIGPQPERLDFESITRQLHSCSTELGTVIHAGTFGKEIGGFLLKTAQELEDMMQSPDQAHILDSRSLVHQIEFSTNMYTSMMSQVSVLRDRVNNHINLSFSLIAQDENRISRLVAEESAMIAVATKRDSAAMKSIALLTIVFLPPTFVATFFSMTMFNWTPDPQNTGVASKYLWVYWVVAVPLTVVVLIIWRFWMNNEDRTYKADLRKAKEEKSKLQASSEFTETEVKATRKSMADYSDVQREQARLQRRKQSLSTGNEGSLA